MDNLDFGWEFGLLITVVMFCIYLLIAFTNYGLVLWIGNSIKRLLERTIWKEKEVFSILNLILIYLPIALLIQFGITESLTYLILNDNGQLNFVNSFGGSFFIEMLFFYFSAWISSVEVVGIILFRKKYNQKWGIVGKESWGKRVAKMWLLLLIFLGVRLFFKTFMNYYYIGNLAIYWILWIIETGIAAGIIFLMLKYRNRQLDT